MNKLVEFQSDYGTILIEAEETTKGARRSFSSGDVIVDKATEKFDQSINVLQVVSNSIIGKLNDVEDALKPNEIEVKVGLKFTAEAGAFIAKTSAEGNLEVIIKWKNENKPLA